MKNREYWRNRSEDVMKRQLNKGVEYYNDLERQYERASANIQMKIESFYQRYADNEEISMQSARMELNSRELKEFRMNVEEYIEKGRQLSPDSKYIKELERASTRHHVSRLEAMKLEMQGEIENLYGYEVDGLQKLMKGVYTEGYYRTAYEIQKGIGAGSTIQAINPDKLEKVINKPWATDGMNFSERVWGKHRPELVNYLNTEFTQAMIRGDNPKTLINNISRKFDVSKRQASTLVMTEDAFFSSEATKDCFNDIGVEEYEIIATLDHKTSAVCQDLDGEHFPVSEYEAGVNAPPFHPNCRCTTVPYFDDKFENGQTRLARDADGTQYEVPQYMTYTQWKNEHIEAKNMRTVYPKGYVEDRVIGKQITKEELDDFKSIIESKGITLGYVNEEYGGFENFFGDYDSLMQLAEGFTEAREINNLPHLKKDIILRYDYLKTDSGAIDLDAFAMTRGRTITINKQLFDDVNVSIVYDESVKRKMFVDGTSLKNVAVHEYGHLFEQRGKKTLAIVSETVIMKAGGDAVKYIKDNISIYSAVIDSENMIFPEIVAELFSMLTTKKADFAIQIFKEAGISI